jgi:hypothetical protein
MKRRQKARPGELRLTFGRIEGEPADGIAAWGEGCSRRDGALLLHYVNPPPTREARSLLSELAARGYDLSTLVFSVMKKPDLARACGTAKAGLK